MSGMPGMCLPVGSGGIGFNYRLGMGIPDMWIRLIREGKMEKWNMSGIYYQLTEGRPSEKTISYAESHDQALVGDKTLIFRLADAEMYDGMDKIYHSLAIDNAIDMHKLIRFVTLTLARNGYLNFMGNEFGHPEWIDFPREGNGWSYKYARRQWSLSTNPFLKYMWLNQFDEDMIHLVRKYHLLESGPAESLYIENDHHTFSFCRGNLIFVFNLHPNKTEDDHFVRTRLTGDGSYKVIFSSDDACYGGQDRISHDYVFTTEENNFGEHGFPFYLPCRTAAVLQKVSI
jgi:1,4-alpha-glucan branching enzyme